MAAVPTWPGGNRTSVPGIPVPALHHSATLKQLGQDWPTIKTHIKNYIATCPVCQKLNVTRKTTHAHPFVTSTSKPMSILNIDFVGPFPTKEYILVVIDKHSRWIELYLELVAGCEADRPGRPADDIFDDRPITTYHIPYNI